MRTTVTLDADVEAIVRAAMRERGLSFKEALNDAVRRGLTSRAEVFRGPSFAMGTPAVPLSKALSLAAEIEDEELVRKLAIGK